MAPTKKLGFCPLALFLNLYIVVLHSCDIKIHVYFAACCPSKGN